MNGNRSEAHLTVSYFNKACLGKELCQSVRLQEIVYRLWQVGVGPSVSGHSLAHQGNHAVEVKAK